MKKWLEIEPLIDSCFYSFFAKGPLGVAILDQDHHLSEQMTGCVIF